MPPTRFTTTAASHAIVHCSNITSSAHFPPSSRFIDAMAATQGVYKRQNTRSAIALTGEMIPSRKDVFGISTESVDITLSLAINPHIRAVQIRQSPNPAGEKTGDITPAIEARMLDFESSTTLNLKSKFCNIHIIIVARKIMVNAFWRKSLAFSHNSCATFFIPGIR